MPYFVGAPTFNIKIYILNHLIKPIRFGLLVYRIYHKQICANSCYFDTYIGVILPLLIHKTSIIQIYAYIFSGRNDYTPVMPSYSLGALASGPLTRVVITYPRCTVAYYSHRIGASMRHNTVGVFMLY